MSIYTVENFTSDITVEGYIAEFRDDKRIKGKHDIYFVFGNGKFLFDEWKFTK